MNARPTPSMSIAFSNSYARLPERFYATVAPTSAINPKLIQLNRPLAVELGLVVKITRLVPVCKRSGTTGAGGKQPVQTAGQLVIFRTAPR